MVCNLLDLNCIIVNELIGNNILAMIIFAILFFIFSSKVKIGFEQSITLFIPSALAVLSLAMGASGLIIIIVILAGFLLSIVINRIIGNRLT